MSMSTPLALVLVLRGGDVLASHDGAAIWQHFDVRYVGKGVLEAGDVVCHLT